MRKLSTVVAALAVGSLLTGFVSSASAEPRPQGGLCGFSSTNDETGAVNQDPRHNYGEIDYGPLVIRDLGGASVDTTTTPPTVTPPTTAPSTGSGTLRCWLQTTANYNLTAPKYGYPGLVGIEVPCNPGCVGVAPIEYDADPLSDIYLCITVTGTPANWLWDDVDGRLEKPGEDTVAPVCGLAISAG
ncbi:MAG TPA: hypothetical protein VFQ85_02035 [Mycobacteriales bacterium]|nr:hypothetical protein [Mycobacteriales bacterium]